VSAARPIARRALSTGLLVAVLVGAGAGTASAHVEVSAPGAVAGTGPVTLVFTAAAESATGIAALRTQLPEGIAPDVTLASGPPGWALTATADGFEVGGPALAPGTDAEYAVTVARLPAGVTELAFPTVQRYADGSEEAWIEPAVAGAPEPRLPAPVLTVAPGAPAPATAAAPAPSSGPPTTDTAPATTPALAPAVDDEIGGGWLAGLGVLALAALGGGLWLRRSRTRRRS
jgi:uncharacterized protein YcnI